ncbi:Alpha-pyrone synthesis polyketide synthase-like Pks11 [Actinomadura rubteroloni]|uniref:Alpha-pyrone synthesis polyketide synthase-like Pks11 n=1 Tax=Actinomadura rubteroloni TaxID=1926885 RepID=A0A2P4UIW4_9ACTN|nr:3-oxoacyl-[acyl-carrier-protein] synthase III C-terminal domain-containing protein [Actinomadura rubteroloni]POM25002.1 Alpha-pyrone synthesis polyketide synthase-like Pks11 [Actinomadura rubteroloni]
MTTIAAVRGALPVHRYPQTKITDTFADVCALGGTRRGLLERVRASAGVQYRHLAVPLDEYARIDGFGAANDLYIEHAADLGAEAAGRALDAAGLTPADVDVIMLVSITGIAAPSLDARLAGRLGLRPDVKRVPIFGLGCVGGAAGLARLHDHLRGWPDAVGLLLSVELCSLTVQRDDDSIANLVAAALFGDGAAAVVACGARRGREHDGPTVVASRSHLYPDSQDVMGWRVSGDGFRIVLDASVPDVVRSYLAADVDGFLADHGLAREDVAAWVCHPGGPKVLEAVAEALDLPDGALDVTWDSLAAQGNLSSSSVLHVLRDTVERRPEPGTPGVVMALGPGFCSELVLVRW